MIEMHSHTHTYKRDRPINEFFLPSNRSMLVIYDYFCVVELSFLQKQMGVKKNWTFKQKAQRRSLHFKWHRILFHPHFVPFNLEVDARGVLRFCLFSFIKLNAFWLFYADFFSPCGCLFFVCFFHSFFLIPFVFLGSWEYFLYAPNHSHNYHDCY